MNFYVYDNQILSTENKEFKMEFSSHMEALNYLLNNQDQLENELETKLNVDSISEGYNKLLESNQKEIEESINNKVKVNWRMFANRKENYLSGYFTQVRKDFLNQFSNLEKGKINYELSKHQDSISPSNFAHVESLFLNGWRYEEGNITKDNYITGLSKTKLKYMEYLTDDENLKQVA